MTFREFLAEEAAAKKKSAMDTNIPGLTIEWTKAGTSLYPALKHIKSGKNVKKWHSRPLEGGKKRFIEFINNSKLKDFDWDMTEKEMMKTEKERSKVILHDLDYGSKTSYGV